MALGIGKLVKGAGNLAKKGLDKTKETIEENDLDNLAGIVAKGAQLKQGAENAAKTAKGKYDTTAEDIKDKGLKEFAKGKVTEAKDAGTKKAAELKDKALNALEDTAQTIKASAAATDAIAKQKENPEAPVVIVATETDREGNITKFGSGVKVPKAALETKGKDEQQAIKQLAANLKTDLDENGAKTTLEEVTATVQEQHGSNAVVFSKVIASRQKD